MPELYGCCHNIIGFHKDNEMASQDDQGHQSQSATAHTLKIGDKDAK